MSRSRSYRRAQLAKAKQRARNLYVRIWQVKSRVLLPGARIWTVPGPVVEPDPAWIGKMAATHCCPCSCPGCQSESRRPDGPEFESDSIA